MGWGYWCLAELQKMQKKWGSGKKMIIRFTINSEISERNVKGLVNWAMRN